MAWKSSPGAPLRPNRIVGNNESRVANAALHGFEELPWRTICARKQIVGTNESRVANAALHGLEELPWRTLCARKQIVGTNGGGCRLPNLPLAKS